MCPTQRYTLSNRKEEGVNIIMQTFAVTISNFTERYPKRNKGKELIYSKLLV